MPKHRENKLKSLGFSFDRHGDMWKDPYQELVAFKMHHGHCLVSQKHQDHSSLSVWVNTQQKMHNNKQLDETRRKLLVKVGFAFSALEEARKEKFRRLVECKKLNDNCSVPSGYRNLFKGWISKQWIDRQRDHIGDKATTKNNTLNWATTVVDYFFTQWFKVWDQRNLDRHGHDYQGRANKLKDITFREITHLYTFAEAVPEDIRWLFQTPLEECMHWPLFCQRAWISNWENVIKKEYATQMEMG